MATCESHSHDIAGEHFLLQEIVDDALAGCSGMEFVKMRPVSASRHGGAVAERSASAPPTSSRVPSRRCSRSAYECTRFPLRTNLMLPIIPFRYFIYTLHHKCSSTFE